MTKERAKKVVRQPETSSLLSKVFVALHLKRRNAREDVIYRLERFLKQEPKYQARNWGEFAEPLINARNIHGVDITSYLLRFKANMDEYGDPLAYRNIMKYLEEKRKGSKKT